MLRCEECEFFSRDQASGRITLRCDPFRTAKESECLDKWQLLRLDALLQSYQATLRWYQKLAPMQEKMFEMMKREMDGLDEADSWKQDYDEDEEFDEQDEDAEDDLPYR